MKRKDSILCVPKIKYFFCVESSSQLYVHFYFHFFYVGSGAVALAHLDGNGTDDAVSTMVHRVQNLGFGYDGRIELQLIGGYRDQPGGYAEDLFYNIMRKSILFYSYTHKKSGKNKVNA